MGLIDKGKTLTSWQHAALTYALMGTLSAGDYLGDTSAETGLSLPAGMLEAIHYNAGTESGSGTEITVHNVTAGTSVTLTPDGSANSVDVTLPFDSGDELALEVTSVDGTTAGANVQLALDYHKGFTSST
jgi:hypothetical protein